MNATTRRLALQLFALGLAGAVPVLLGPPWAPAASVAIAAAGTVLIVCDIRRRLIAPLEQLAGLPGLPAAEDTAHLARALACEYREAMDRLRDAESGAARRREAMDHAREGTLLLDDAGRVEYANAAAKALLGAPLELAGRPANPVIAALASETELRDAPAERELVLYSPGPRRVLARAVPLSEGLVVLLRDLADEDRVDRIRRDFVANVSHELKTPVAGLRALADVAVTALADDDLHTASGFVERIAREGTRLSNLVNDLLDLSRVEAGASTRDEPVNLRELLDETAQRLRPAAEAKGVRLEVSGDGVEVPGDRIQLATAAQNLVENAVRYSEAGTVRCNVAACDGTAQITISDEGIGIPTQDLPRIFERFYRVDRARARATGGTGLGLSIVRHVVENHGGRIDVASELGVGTTFTVRLKVSHDEGNAA